jgi:hypothetical protein
MSTGDPSFVRRKEDRREGQNACFMITVIEITYICYQDAATNQLFLSSSGWTSKKFEWNLERYCKLLGPTAKCITMLESTRSGPGDVYLCFLANAAALHEVLTEGNLDLLDADLEHIRLRFNHRYKTLIHQNLHDIYFTSFILDPREFFTLDIFSHLT